MNNVSRLIGIIMIGVLTAVISVPFCPPPAGAGEPYTVTQKWATGPGLLVPESVLYNAADSVLYVSCINGKPLEKNRKGFIAKLTLDGRIQTLKWATGLNAPKGSAIYGDALYVSDIDHLVRINRKTGAIEKQFPGENAKFLNDVAIDARGNVYVTDMSDENSVIYRLQDEKLQVWLQGPEIKNPNGLAMEAGRLIVGNSGDGCIKSVNLTDGVITTIARVGSGIDGLRPDGNGNYLVSDWQGRTSLVTASGKVHTLLDTTEAKINAADLEYIVTQKLLLIPTFFDNRVVAYQLN